MRLKLGYQRAYRQANLEKLRALPSTWKSKRSRSDAPRARQVVRSLLGHRMDSCDGLFCILDGVMLMHGPDRKPARGVCQVCGRPVVAYEYEARGGCIRPGPTLINGHTYDRHGRLVEVRCPEHHNGLRIRQDELNRAPTQEELELASKIRGSAVTYEAPPWRDPNILVFPVIARPFPTLLAKDIVSVQPMTGEQRKDHD